MFSHIMVGTSDLERSRKFYDATLGALGVKPGFQDKNRIFWRTKTGTFGVSIPINGEPCTFANGGTIGFAVETTEQADAWHAAGIANGGTAIGSACNSASALRRRARLAASARMAKSVSRLNSAAP